MLISHSLVITLEELQNNMLQSLILRISIATNNVATNLFELSMYIVTRSKRSQSKQPHKINSFKYVASRSWTCCMIVCLDVFSNCYRRSWEQMFFRQWKNRIMKQKAMVPQHSPYLEHAMSDQRNCILLRQVCDVILQESHITNILYELLHSWVSVSRRLSLSPYLCHVILGCPHNLKLPN